jgi:2'-5' RNA ligase
MARLSAYLYPDLYKELGVDANELGCIMLDVAPFEVVSMVEDGEADIYHHPDQVNHKYTGGAPAEHVAHLTLLYGLLESGQKWKGHVDTVLDGWTPPALKIEKVSHFPGSLEGEDYSVIIGQVELTPELVEGHDRLSLLPHIDTFPGYHPHITLAYIKNGPSSRGGGENNVEKWIRSLNNAFAGKTFPVTRINYGDEED